MLSIYYAKLSEKKHFSWYKIYLKYISYVFLSPLIPSFHCPSINVHLLLCGQIVIYTTV